MPDPDAQAPRPRGFTKVAAVLVLAAASGAILVAATSGFALLPVVPYAGVGALLAIRRPRTSIGWLLLVMAWLHALATAPVDSTVRQFEEGAPPLLAALGVATSAAGGVLFAAYALLAIVFPSGFLPGGAWGRLARIALVLDGAAIVVGLMGPSINVNLPGFSNGALVPNPLAVAPGSAIWNSLNPNTLFPVLVLTMAGAGVSLFVRLRRATGVEQQQLRWIAVATLLVVASVLAGLALSALIPGSADTGLIWIPAILAFPTVALAIGIAVLRYRLYEIDTIVNRAIVYGLLTAILAGSSAAMIGLFERAFEGAMGPGSEASIILTTLLVVTAFNPVKTRLQAVVDRRFRETRDPVADLAAFEVAIRGGISRPDRERVLRRLVEVAMMAFAATGAALDLHGPAAATWSTAAGKPLAGEPFVVTGAAGGAEVELRLAGVAAPRAVDALRSALVAALEETGA
jgi:hypothetical protein